MHFVIYTRFDDPWWYRLSLSFQSFHWPLWLITAIELYRTFAHLSFFALFADVFCSLCFLRVSCSQWHPLMNSTVHSNLQAKVATDNKKWTLKISAISNRYYLWTQSLRITFVAFIMMRKISKSCLRMKTNLRQGPRRRRSSMSSHQSATRSSWTSCQWRHRLSWSDPRAQGHSAAPVIPNLR